jgi:hypothetical protein
LTNADCLWRVIGKEAQYCGGTPPTTIWSDNFDGAATGWTFNPGGTDTATLGRFEIGNPETTSSNGTKQLGTTQSGSNDLVTGRLAGSGAGSYDVDGGDASLLRLSRARNQFLHGGLLARQAHWQYHEHRLSGARGHRKRQWQLGPVQRRPHRVQGTNRAASGGMR